MKTILIEVPINGNITNYEIERAKCNRMEYLQGMSNYVPNIINNKTKLKIKESIGLWNLLTGCLP